MLPPKSADLKAEAVSCLRTHWDEISPYVKAISGEGPTINGSPAFDEFGAIVEVQKIAKSNGYAMLGNVTPAELLGPFRRAYKSLAGHGISALKAQNKRLRIEHKTASASAE
jgi:hypothetical protein